MSHPGYKDGGTPTQRFVEKAGGLMVELGLALHAIGMVDDRQFLGPAIKLVIEIAICLGIVLLCPRVRVLTALGKPADGGLH